ncbi:MAG: hypothetical protein FWC20_05695 [Oscillospiraceae bacterium]|nr:hypothetical protein [Oscillospiraceae bacterium]MCL2278886.1 hypothetical protein [Oscillospiraceae bacterium]
MKVKMLIASDDARYTMKLSEQISKNHSDTLEVFVCSNPDVLEETILLEKVEIVLIDQMFVKYIEEIKATLPLIMRSETPSDEASGEFTKIEKYGRISEIVADILETYSKVSKKAIIGGQGKAAGITAVWSPAGGVGKTTVALAAAVAAVQNGKRVFYLNLETFSSIPIYFDEGRKSISSVFEMLESNEGDVKMLISGISTEENGITYLSKPGNYDDVNILSAENIEELILSCGALTDELFIDISLPCDERTKKVFAMAGKVLLVSDRTETAKTKLSQFISQNSIFDSIREKTDLVANKGAVLDGETVQSVHSLPMAATLSESLVYKELAQHFTRSNI